MSVPVTVFASPEELGRAAAREVADGIAAAYDAGSWYVLGCPGGRTPRTTYQALADEVARRGLALDHVVIAMVDDYVSVGPGGERRRVPIEASYSCHRFARDEIQAPLNAASRGSRIPDDHVWLPDPAAPEEYDIRLSERGGVALFLLASGAGDGHVAFNPPGAGRDTRTRVVTIPASTKRDNLGTFPEFGSPGEVPDHGVTVGVETIVGSARRLLMLVHGTHKRTALARLAAADAYDPSWPATVVAEGADADIYADAAAAAGLERMDAVSHG
ncbi:MAG: hypothetical protein GEV10_08905 [Streptosporangiales bacterium]|nr:hypothetical protein [Streptosporangiales bacterium]